jgi:peptidoglycan hydrolase-like protein with peptidoglycan-binding domain
MIYSCHTVFNFLHGMRGISLYRIVIVGCVAFFAFSICTFVDFGKDPVFALGSPTWTTSTPFTGVSSPTSTPVIFDGSNFVVAFAQSGGSATNIYISTSTDGTSWSPTSTVITTANAGDQVLDIEYYSTSSEYGLIYNDNTTNDVYFTSSTDLVSWSSPTLAMQNLKPTLRSAFLDYSSSGKLAIAYMCQRTPGDCDADTSIGFAASEDGSTWTTSTAKTTTGSDAALAGFEFYGEEARLVWSDTVAQGEEGEAYYYFSTSSDYGASWSANTTDSALAGPLPAALNTSFSFRVSDSGVNTVMYVSVGFIPFPMPTIIPTIVIATSTNGVNWSTIDVGILGIDVQNVTSSDAGFSASLAMTDDTVYALYTPSQLGTDPQIGALSYSAGTVVTTTLDSGYASSSIFMFSGLATNNDCYIVGAYSVPGRDGEMVITSAQDGTCASGATVPTAPSNFTTSTVSSTYASFTWDDNSDDEDKFIFDYIASTDIADFPGTVDDIDANAEAATTPGLTPNQVYTFRIAAVNTAGTSTYATTTFYTDAVAPSAISASASGQSSVIVSWTDDTNASGSTYQISYTDGTPIDTTTNKSYTVTGLSAGTAYSFKVRTQYAGDSATYSSYSSTASATTNAVSSSGGGGGGSFSSPSPIFFDPVTKNELKNEDILLINEGALTTNTTTVQLSIAEAIDVTLIAVSNDSSFLGVGYEPYVSTKQWALTAVNGDKMVYVKLRTAQGGEKIVTDSITLTGQLIDAISVDTSGCPVPVDMAYKSPSSPSVYYVSQAHHADGSVDTSIPCTKRAFTTSQKFFTYFTNWNQVVPTTESVLKSIPLDPLGFMPEGPLYDPQYGALVKIVADPKVYLLLGGNKYWITSEAVFTGLKYSWSWIEGVADELLNKYITKEEITYTDHHPNYTLVKYQSSPKVYRLESHPTDSTKQVKRHVTDEATFRALHFRWDRIVTIDETETYETGAPLTTPSSTTRSVPTNTTRTQLSQTSFTSFLTLGSVGSEVLLLQQTLQSLGFFPTNITPNGNFGPATESAVRAFQTTHSIDPLGYVGPGTREVLNGLL